MTSRAFESEAEVEGAKAKSRRATANADHEALQASASCAARSTTVPRPRRCPRSRWRSASAVLTVVAAYWFGKRKGKKRQMVEIRRI